MDSTIILGIGLTVLLIVILILLSKLKQKGSQLQLLNEQLTNYERTLEKKENDFKMVTEKIGEYEKKYNPLIILDQEITLREININELNETFMKLNEKYQSSLILNRSLEAENELYIETLDISTYGLFKPQHSFDLPEQYLVELEGVYNKQKALIKTNAAAICHTEWSVEGSKAEGRRMTNQELKLMLLAFNGESDSIIARVKWNNVVQSRQKIHKSFHSINKLGTVSHCEITREYVDLKIDELNLVYEYQMKKHEQKEEQRLIREQMREEEKVQRESERVQREAEEEAKLYNKVLEKARIELGYASKEEAFILEDKIKILEEKLKAAIEKKERAISLAQTTKVGNIYIISNIGSFGENIYKIGMTRRFDPMERVKELSDAALPFQFDVHAIIYSENAPQFERDLHRKFTDRRINRVNSRKEFFKVTLEEIESFVLDETKAEIQFTKMAEAREYRQTLVLLEKSMLTNQEQSQKQKYPSSLID